MLFEWRITESYSMSDYGNPERNVEHIVQEWPLRNVHGRYTSSVSR